MPNLGPFSPAVALATDYLGRLVAVDGQVCGMLCIPLTITDAATGDVDFTLLEKFEVVRVDCIKRNGAGAGNTMQVKNGATAITNAIAVAVDDTLTSSGTIDDAQSTIAAGGTLRVTATRAAGTRNCQIFVYGFIRP